VLPHSTHPTAPQQFGSALLLLKRNTRVDPILTFCYTIHIQTNAGSVR